MPFLFDYAETLLDTTILLFNFRLLERDIQKDRGRGREGGRDIEREREGEREAGRQGGREKEPREHRHEGKGCDRGWERCRVQAQPLNSLTTFSLTTFSPEIGQAVPLTITFSSRVVSA